MSTGTIKKVAGPLVIAEGMRDANMFDVVRVSGQRLIGEIIEIHGDEASIQVYEETSGLGPGEPVESMGVPMSVELGPGLITSIYDGIQRPLDDIMKISGNNLKRGVEVASLKRDKKWEFVPAAKVGDEVEAGDVLGTVQETIVVQQKIMVPYGVKGTVKEIKAGTFTVEEVVAVIATEKGDKELTMMQRWPVRKGRPYQKKLPPVKPLVTGQRVIDTFFPIAKGGVAAVPGPFGSGKTVIQHQLAKWAEAGYISEDEVTKTTTDTTTQTQDWGISWWTDIPVNAEANSRYNEYEDGRKPAGVEDEQQPLEELCEDLPEYSDADFEELLNKIEEGFFPESSIAACEPAIQEEKKHRKKLKSTPASDQDEVTDDEEEQDESKNRHAEKQHGNESAGESGWKRNEHKKQYEDVRQNETESRHVNASRYESDSRQPHEAGRIGGESSDEKYAQVNDAEAQKARETYQAKFGVADRMSERQLSELKHQLMHETRISPEERKQYLDMLEEKEQDRKLAALNKKAENSANKNYAVMRRVYDEIAEEKLPQEKKQNLLLNLKQKMQTQAEREVAELVGKMPPNMDRARYHALREKLKEYEGVDLTPYQERLESQKNLAEQQEIKNMIRQSRKITRDDLTELKERLKEKEFEPGLVLPYFEQIENKIRQMDENEIAEITGDPAHMSFDEGMDAYQKIAEGPYLPDLKDNALELLSRRLSKIKTDECEQLVNKLKNELEEAGITESQKHYFYPARKVLLKQAAPQETEVIDYAMASYAAGNGLFEYPIFVVDTSRNNSGKEGIILTPEHLYYSTLMTSYRIDVPSIDEITASTGLLNRGVYVTEKNGKKTKIPYAVENKQLTAYAGVLNEFIHYLQEKPDSRNISYLAKEKHDTICCFRCGYVYKGGNSCPQCGFKNNA